MQYYVDPGRSAKQRYLTKRGHEHLNFEKDGRWVGGGIWPPLGLQGAWLCDDGAFWETSWPDGTAHRGGAKVKSETTLQLILDCQLGTEEGGGGSLKGGGIGGIEGGRWDGDPTPHNLGTFQPY